MKLTERFQILLKPAVFLCLLLVTASMFAQNATQTVTGTIVDENGEPVIGAAVIDATNPSNGSITDENGTFSIRVASGTDLNVSCMGFMDTKISVQEGRSSYNLVLTPDAEMLEETVVVGYGVQKKITTTGAISAIKSQDIVTTKNESVVNMLTGKVSGLRVRQNTSEPGSFNTSMDIRGFGTPLVVIDGVPRDNMARLNPEDIESISVLKDASAAIYGVRAANGVILITTKKGNKGAATINYSGTMTWQVPSNFPHLVGAVDWMTLKNELSMHNVDNQGNITYSQEQIDEYASGAKTSTDWIDEVFSKAAPQTQHNLNISGGTDKVSYFASFGYQYQDSFLKSDAIDYNKFNLRSNLSAKLMDGLTVDLNLAGMKDEKTTTPYGTSDIVRMMWLMKPTDEVWYSKENNQYAQPQNTSHINPVAMMDRDLTGKNSYKSKWFQSSATATYELPWVKGLSIKAMYSYDYIMNDNKQYSTAYHLYRSDGDNVMEYTWLTRTEANNRIARYYYTKTNKLWNASINYQNSFGKHNVQAMILYEDSHKTGDNFYGERQLNLDIDEIFAGISDTQQINQSTSSGALYDFANRSYVGRLNYDYASKYLAEFSFRYEGSSKFPKDSRWGFFPSASIGYRISEENFWKQSPLSFIENFKIRASYGVLGDDSALAYQFVSGYYYPAVTGVSSSGLTNGYVFDGKFVNSSENRGLVNNDITWYKSKTLNIGIDASAWNGLLSTTLEYFNRYRTDLLATRVNSLPGIVGASLPQENLNSDRTQGFEIELGHQNHIDDFYYSVKANLSYTRTKTCHYEQARQGNSYLNWRSNNNNRYNNIWWGYSGNGRIESWDEIWYNPVLIGRGTLPGDYEYEDWNGDGMISDLDVHPLATNGLVPLINYGITLNASWKGFDLSMLFQGAGKRYVAFREFLYQPLWSDTNALEGFMDRWHPKNSTDNPYDPATVWTKGDNAYTGTNPNASSDFNIQNAAYLRLKNIELGYTLPEKITRKVNIQSLRIYVNAYNLLTFTKLKYLDPEFYMTPSGGSLSALGYNYPLNKTYSIGLNIKF